MGLHAGIPACDNIGKFEECADFVEVDDEVWDMKTRAMIP
jgi:hypothetical protein